MVLQVAASSWIFVQFAASFVDHESTISCVSVCLCDRDKTELHPLGAWKWARNGVGTNPWVGTIMRTRNCPEKVQQQGRENARRLPYICCVFLQMQSCFLVFLHSALFLHSVQIHPYLKWSFAKTFSPITLCTGDHFRPAWSLLKKYYPVLLDKIIKAWLLHVLSDLSILACGLVTKTSKLSLRPCVLFLVMRLQAPMDISNTTLGTMF